MPRFSDNIYKGEEVFNYPIPQDGITTGSISLQGVSALLEVDGKVIGGSYTFPTITITLKGIPVPGPIVNPTPSQVGNLTFSFRNKTWKVLKVIEGGRFNIAGQPRYLEWSVTAVDTSKVEFTS